MPREHGAWGILGVSFALGLAAAGGASWVSLLLALAGLGALLARRPLLGAIQSRGARPADVGWACALLGSAAALAVAALVVRPDLWVPILIEGALFVIDTALRVGRVGRTPLGEIPGVAGLAWAAALAHASVLPAFGPPSAALGGLCAIYFIGSIPFVRGFVRARAAQRQSAPDPRRHALPAALYYLAAINVVGLLAIVRWMPFLAALSLVPAALKAVMLAFGPAKLDRRVQQIGYLEVAHSLLFAALAWFAFYAAAV
jgi:hypothetical protein